MSYENRTLAQLERQFVGELGCESFRIDRARDQRRWVATVMTPTSASEAVPFAAKFTPLSFEGATWGAAIVGLLGRIERYYAEGGGRGDA